VRPEEKKPGLRYSFANFVIDQSTGDSTYIEMQYAGDGDLAALDSARSSAPTEIRDSCLAMDGPRFTGSYSTSGMSYTSCERATVE